MNIDLSTLLAILAMGLATYATRLSGYWLLQGREISGRARAALDAVPPAILIAVIAPAIFLRGMPELIAGAIVVAATMLRLPLLVVVAIGAASVAIARVYFI
jgi:uncharacterized membrane protein